MTRLLHLTAITGPRPTAIDTRHFQPSLKRVFNAYLPLNAPAFTMLPS